MAANAVPMTAVYEAVLERGAQPSASERLRQQGEEAYEMRVIRAFFALGSTFEELWHLQTLFRKASNIQEIRVLLKVYVTSWATLSDVAAIMVNEVYDLGYAEQDIEFTAILRNRRIRRTSLGQIVAKHRASVQHERYAKLRNDVVHRGKLDDPELDQLLNEWISKSVLLSYTETPADVQAEPDRSLRAAREMNLDMRLNEFVETRCKTLSEHLAATKVLLDEMGLVLATRVRESGA